MQFKIDFRQKEDLYHRILAEISGVHFTLREIDLLACFVYGMNINQIEGLLCLGKRVIRDRTKVLVNKKGFNNIEELVNFIKTDTKVKSIKLYFLNLVAQYFFENKLHQIGEMFNQREICFNDSPIAKEQQEFCSNILKHLKMANFLVHDEKKLNIANIYLVLEANQDSVMEKSTHPPHITLRVTQNTNEFSVQFSSDISYYSSFMQLLSKIIASTKLEKLAKEFEKEFQKVILCTGKADTEIKQFIDDTHLHTNGAIKISTIAIFIAVLMTILSSTLISTLVVYYNKLPKKNVKTERFSVDETMLLKRQSILRQINKKLDGDAIKTVMLVGTEGSGKTTIARQYIEEYKGRFYWELDATTNDTLYESFKLLANRVCKTNTDLQELATIKSIKDLQDSKNRLKIFVKKHLKNNPGWLLVFDNVKKFSVIEWYFPENAKSWGYGKIIINSTDYNIIHNRFISSKNIVYVDELTNIEKLDLYNIFYPNNPHDQRDLIDFLEFIPSYPLDVFLAAQFMKRYTTTFTEFLTYKAKQSPDFIQLQQEILRSKGDYNKTRYTIIKAAIDKLQKIDTKFKDLLLFTVLLAPHHIPIDLLILYNNDAKVTHFVNILKHLALVKHDFSHSDTSNRFFSFEPRIQSLILKYFHLGDNEEELKLMTQAFVKYSQEVNKHGDLQEIRDFISHGKVLLQNINFLVQQNSCNHLSRADINYEIGVSCLNIKNYGEAEKYLNLSLAHCNNGEKQFIAKIYIDLGRLYRFQGDYKKSEELLEKGFIFYKNYYGVNHIKTMWAYVNLGSVYRSTRNYQKSLKCLQEALSFYRNYYGDNHIETAHILYELGCLYDSMLDHQKATSVLQKSLNVLKKHYAKDDIRFSQVAIRLANVFRKLGEFKKAKSLLEKHIQIYRNYYGTTHIDTVWALSYLGAVYRDIGSFKQSLEILEAWL